MKLYNLIDNNASKSIHISTRLSIIDGIAAGIEPTRESAAELSMDL